MKVDNPQAFRYIMHDEIYLLAADKALLIPPAVENAPDPAEQPAAETTLAVAEAAEPATPVITEQPVAQPAPIEATSTTHQPTVQTADTEFNYLGKNNKNFLVLVNYPNEEHIAAAHLPALESILKRKELSLDDVAILNVNKYAPVKLAALAAYFKPTRLVIMGSDSMPDGIGNLPLNKPLQGKKTHVLYSFSFDEMMSSNDNKKTFWEHMKTL
ncbi:hypothetical protein EWM62_17465 [Mucilaginibacter terrigena]|uniref:Uncharacterized protein n=1 Tax=Mucilaginibacter terrigena TaxID=2492395 RepID=A0A4Q5LHV8_9SPHI|nr:hypothetical protein [Mucilaginibacter terrigena]RYU86939.1 hypothetical protein EWM62_17465 [Mucilaginibacter terrigena]